MLQKILLSELTLRDVERLASLFERALINDWNTCDWFCVKVLGDLIARDLPERRLADAIARWRDAKHLWQRRAANVASFVKLAKRSDGNFPGFTRLMLEACAVTVRSPSPRPVSAGSCASSLSPTTRPFSRSPRRRDVPRVGSRRSV